MLLLQQALTLARGRKHSRRIVQAIRDALSFAGLSVWDLTPLFILLPRNQNSQKFARKASRNPHWKVVPLLAMLLHGVNRSDAACEERMRSR